MKRPLPDKEAKLRVLLLQGPVGPFFKHLRTYLETRNIEVWHVCFNAGDCFYSPRKRRINFDGDLAEWNEWCSDFIRNAQIDRVVLFGSERPVHRVARRVAKAASVPVVSLEEGYIRPGFIAVEFGGNNANSPLTEQLPPSDIDISPATEAGKNYRPGAANTAFNIIYYAIRNVFTFGKQRELFHKRFSLISECFCRSRWIYRMLHGKSRKLLAVQQLLEHHDGKYYLVPLQVESDCQLKEFAMGWNQKKLISEVLKSFAEKAPKDALLVFKVHPMALGHCNDGPLIVEMAEIHRISERVKVFEVGSLGLLTRHSAGMITINSTSGLSAIHHGVPLLVVGRAFYAHPLLTVCGNGNPDFDSFWSCRHVAEESFRYGYLSWVRQEALVPGDYYVEQGMQPACDGILAKLLEQSTTDIGEVNARGEEVSVGG